MAVYSSYMYIADSCHATNYDLSTINHAPFVTSYLSGQLPTIAFQYYTSLPELYNVQIPHRFSYSLLIPVPGVPETHKN